MPGIVYKFKCEIFGDHTQWWLERFQCEGQFYPFNQIKVITIVRKNSRCNHNNHTVKQISNRVDQSDILKFQCIVNKLIIYHSSYNICSYHIHKVYFLQLNSSVTIWFPIHHEGAHLFILACTRSCQSNYCPTMGSRAESSSSVDAMELDGSFSSQRGKYEGKRCKH